MCLRLHSSLSLPSTKHSLQTLLAYILETRTRHSLYIYRAGAETWQKISSYKRYFFSACLQFIRVVNQIQAVLKVVEILTFASWLFFTNFAVLNTGKTDVVKPAGSRRPDTKQN